MCDYIPRPVAITRGESRSFQPNTALWPGRSRILMDGRAKAISVNSVKDPANLARRNTLEAFTSGRMTRLGLLVCAVAFNWSATPAQYRFNHWTTESGLPQNSVRSIIQTRDGYLWFTTLDGLVRYDGAQFRVFDKGNTPAMQSNRCFALIEDPEGALWIATEDGGVVRYKDGAFASYTTREGLGSNTVTSIGLDPQGSLLVYTAPTVARWTGERFRKWQPPMGEPSMGLMHRASSGTMWFCDHAGLHRVKDGQSSVFQIDIASDAMTALYEDRDRRLWIGTNAGRIVTFMDGQTRDVPVKIVGFPGYVTTMIQDSRGDIWIGTSKAGLIRVRGGQAAIYNTANGLSDNNVVSIFEDREGTVWVGTGNRGINRVSRQIISVYTSKDGLAGNNVYPIYQDAAGAIWIGANGFSRFSNGGFKTYLPRDGLRFFDVMSICEDQEGRLWLGAVGGLSYMKDGRFIDFTPRIPLPAFNYNVWCIHQARDGALWFGTDHGLIKYKDEALRLYTSVDGLAGDDVKCIHEDAGGILWFGTYGGLSYLKAGVFTRLTESEGLASNRVRTIQEDPDGTLWIGTYDGGFSQYKDGRFINYTAADGLFSNGAFQIIDDLRGNLWITSNRGIYRVSREQLDEFAHHKIKSITCVAYGPEDGLMNSECNGGRQPAGIRARDGKLWFPTQGGVAVVDLANLTENSLPPPVKIEDVILNREPVTFSHEVRIDPGKENIEIHYTGLSFIKPEQVRFKYKLEGLDPEWVEAGSRRAAYYSYLPPGNYTFVVMAANSDGVWSNRSESLRIVVLPPFWRTWWFITLTAAAAAAAAFAVYRRRISALERANAIQEAFSRQLIDSQESERKRIAAELHDSLGQNLLVIKNWAMLALGKLREQDRAQPELSEISTATSLAISEVREISYNLRPHLLDEVGLSEALRSMVKRIGAASEVAFSVDIDPIDRLFPNEAEIGIYRILQEACNNIVRHSRATNASVAVKRGAHEVVLQIGDNGIGLDHHPGAAGRKGFGLLGMSERARMLGGRLIAQSGPGQGTTIEVKLPLEGNET
jgi:signal transduction histidine kinase/ligand-binding sensor domain-containing protein